MGNFNKNQKIYDVKKTIFNTDEDDVYYEDLFFISEAQDIPENDSIVSLYLQEDTAYLFCFFDSHFTEINTVDEELTLPKGDGLFLTVFYKQAVEILKGIGYSKANTDTVSFGVCIDDVLQRTMINIYRERWKRNK